MSHHMYKRWCSVHDEETRPCSEAQLRAMSESDRANYLAAAIEDPLPEGHRYHADWNATMQTYDILREQKDSLLRILRAIKRWGEAEAKWDVARWDGGQVTRDAAAELGDARDALMKLSDGHHVADPSPRKECPYGNMPRSAGAGHWRDWHRGHGCDKDPETSK